MDGILLPTHVNPLHLARDTSCITQHPRIFSSFPPFQSGRAKFRTSSDIPFLIAVTLLFFHDVFCWPLSLFLTLSWFPSLAPVTLHPFSSVVPSPSPIVTLHHPILCLPCWVRFCFKVYYILPACFVTRCGRSRYSSSHLCSRHREHGFFLHARM